MTASPILLTGATFSPCQTFRYTLTRIWAPGAPVCVFIGFNPSTADAFEDDPTIRRCLGFAREWGFGELVMLNLFAHRATDPREIARSIDPVGPMNDAAIDRETRRADRVVCAWGALAAGHKARVAAVAPRLWRPALYELVQLGESTDGGHPRHPLYMPASTQPRPFWVSP